MRILFVASGNTGEIRPSVKKQVEALVEVGLTVDIFLIEGKGILGYLKSIKKIRKQCKANEYDIIHAHYSLSGFAATLAGCKPLLVSLMGSDGQKGGWQRALTRILAKKYWATTIVKSEELSRFVNSDNCVVIPNGVDLQLFKPQLQEMAKKELGLDADKQYVFFAGLASRPVKNFNLAQQAFQLIDKDRVELITMKSMSHNEVPLWMNAADVVLLTSKWEGSPNVIKEAMACNRPIVSTGVGDVRWLLGDLPGHYIANQTKEEIAQKILEAITFSQKKKGTAGRERLNELGLDSNHFGKKIKALYKQILI